MTEKEHQENEKARMSEDLTEEFNSLQQKAKGFWPNIEKLITEKIEQWEQSKRKEIADNTTSYAIAARRVIEDHIKEYHKAERIKFEPPTIEEIKEVGKKYCMGKDFLIVDYEDFRLYWEGQGWKRNKQYIAWIPTLYRWIRTNDRKERWKRAVNIDKELAQKEKRLK